MGSFFQSAHVLTSGHDRVRRALEKLCAGSSRRVWLSPALGRWVSFFPRELLKGTELGQVLSAQCDAPVVLTLVHDSGVFCYLLFEAGRTTEEYVSKPEYFGSAAAEHEPKRILDLLPAGESPSDLHALLVGSPPIFAEEQMTQFTRRLGITNGLSSYDCLERGERENITGWKDFIHIPDLAAEKARRKLDRQRIRAGKRRCEAAGELVFDSELARQGKAIHFNFTVHGSIPGSDGFLVSGYGETTGLCQWRPPDPPRRFVPGIPDHMSVACPLDGGRLLVSLREAVSVVDAAGRVITEIPDVRGQLVACDAAAAVAYVRSGADQLTAFQVSDGAPLFDLPFPEVLAGVALHPREPHLVWSDGRTLAVADRNTGEMLFSAEMLNEQIAFKKADQWLKATGQSITDPDVIARETIHALQLDGTGDRLIIGTDEGLRIYDYATLLSAGDRMPAPATAIDTSAELNDHRWAGAVHVDRARSRIIYSCGDDSLRCHDWITGRNGEFKRSHEKRRILVRGLHLSGDGRRMLLLLGSPGESRPDDRCVEVWDYVGLSNAMSPG